jgi:hypothetical protein
MSLAIPIPIRISQLLEGIHVNIRTHRPMSTPRLLGFAGRAGSAAFAVVGGVTVDAGEGEKRAKSVERAGDNTNALLNYGPETDFARTEHKFCWIAVET